MLSEIPYLWVVCLPPIPILFGKDDHLLEELMHLPVPCKIRFILFGPCKAPQDMRKTFLVM